MLHALTYSIIKHVKDQMPEAAEVVWVYDGIKLSGRTKPLITVEQMPGDNRVITKQREYFESTYRFQIGLRARSISERSRLQAKLKDVLLYPNIELLDTSQPQPPPVAGFFYCDVTSEVPMPAEDVTDETNEHRVYFDVEVIVHRVIGGGLEFNQ